MVPHELDKSETQQTLHQLHSGQRKATAYVQQHLQFLETLPRYAGLPLLLLSAQPLVMHALLAAQFASNNAPHLPPQKWAQIIQDQGSLAICICGAALVFSSNLQSCSMLFLHVALYFCLLDIE